MEHAPTQDPTLTAASVPMDTTEQTVNPVSWTNQHISKYLHYFLDCKFYINEVSNSKTSEKHI